MTLNEAHELTEYANRPSMVGFPWSEREQELINEAYRVIAAARERLWKLTTITR